MVSEKEPLLPTTTIDNNNDETELLKNIDIGYPKYEDGKLKWFFINLWRNIILFVSFSLTGILSIYYSHLISQLSLVDYIIALLVQVLFFFYLFPFLILLLSFPLGQFDFFYLLTAKDLVCKYFTPKNYIFNRLASSKSTTTSSRPYYNKLKE